MKNKKISMQRKKTLIICLLLICTLVMTAIPVQAARKKYKNTWRKQNQCIYYYNKKGKKVTGLQKIGKKYYYFDSKGVQRFGWKKIGNDYYYFKPARGKNASMVKSATVNGITLSKSGKASKAGSNVRKLNLMVTANQIVESQTKPLMSKTEKLRICFEYVKRAYGYSSWRSFRAIANWDYDYAEDMFYRGRGNCFSYAAAFAYLANAVGYTDVKLVSSGGHGWAEIKGKVYDPDWALVSKVDTYFAMSYSLSGVAGRPNYAPNRAYVVTI